MAEGRGVRAGRLAARLEPEFLVLAAAAAARDAGVAWAAVVGGYVRNRFLGEAAADLDLVVPEAGAAVAGRIADALGGRVVPLSRWRQWLIFHPDRRVDVTEADDLEGDLFRRDFTVNAIAWRVLPPTYELVDPLDGLGDLAAGRLRLCRPDALAADPARIVRAARLVASGLTPDRQLLTAARASAGLLADVPLDRVWREWRRLTCSERPLGGLGFLATTGALDVWLGASGWAGEAVGRLEGAGRPVGDAADASRAGVAAAMPLVGPQAVARAILAGCPAPCPQWTDLARRLGCTSSEAARAYRELHPGEDGGPGAAVTGV